MAFTVIHLYRSVIFHPVTHQQLISKVRFFRITRLHNASLREQMSLEELKTATLVGIYKDGSRYSAKLRTNWFKFCLG